MSLNCIKHGPMPVDECSPLWRYVRLPQLLLFLKGSIVLPSVRTLQRHDPKEGDRRWDEETQGLAFPTETFRDLVEYVRGEMSTPARELFDLNSKDHSTYDNRIVFEKWWEVVVSTRFALCFFEAHHESMPMWRHFAPEGVVVRTSLQRLGEALRESGREWLASRMIYADLSREITADEAYADTKITQALQRPFLLKQREYQAENEVRLITVDPEASEYLRVDRVRPELWIEEIRISPGLWSDDAKLLSQHIEFVEPKLAGRVCRSAVSSLPNDDASTFAALHAEVKRDAAERWPGCLRTP